MTYVFIFTSNDFRSWKIEERKRERARRSPTSKQEDRIGARRLHRSDHSNPPSSNPVTDHRDRLAISGPHAKRETERERRSTIALDRRSHQSNDRTRSSIAPVRLQHRSISPSPHDLAFASTDRTQSPLSLPPSLNLTGFDEFFCWVLFLLWVSVELIHFPHVYNWGSVWKIGWLGYVKHFP